MHTIITAAERIDTPEDNMISTDKQNKALEQVRIQNHRKLIWNPDYI